MVHDLDYCSFFKETLCVWIHTSLHALVMRMSKLLQKIIPELGLSIAMSQNMHVVNSPYLFQNKIY